jgi:hypothetical protein
VTGPFDDGFVEVLEPPHKASHTAVAIDTNEHTLDHKKVQACRTQVDRLLEWAEPCLLDAPETSPERPP